MKCPQAHDVTTFDPYTDRDALKLHSVMLIQKSRSKTKKASKADFFLKL